MGVIFMTDKKGEKIWRFDRDGKTSYARRVSKKEGDTWISEYQRVRFKGSPDIPNGTIVHIKYGFETLDTWVKDGKEYTKIILVATDYDYDGMKEVLNPTFVHMPDLPDSFSAAQDEIPF